jgi:hypothetical protein
LRDEEVISCSVTNLVLHKSYLRLLRTVFLLRNPPVAFGDFEGTSRQVSFIPKDKGLFSVIGDNFFRLNLFMRCVSLADFCAVNKFRTRGCTRGFISENGFGIYIIIRYFYRKLNKKLR